MELAGKDVRPTLAGKMPALADEQWAGKDVRPTLAGRDGRPAG